MNYQKSVHYVDGGLASAGIEEDESRRPGGVVQSKPEV